MQVLRCWGDLSTERPIGMAEGAIPWRAIQEWCRVNFEDDPETAEIMTYVIRTLDNNQARARLAEQNQKRALGPGKR